MKTSFVVVAAFTALASAQLPNLPACVQSCLLTAVSSDGCGLTDFACHCKNTGLISQVTPCTSKCSCDDQTTGGAAIVSLCQSAGVPITIPAQATCAASSAPAPASSAPAASSKPAASSAPASYGASSAPAASSKPAASSAPCSTSTVTVTVQSSGAPYPTGGPKPSGPTGTAAPTYPAKTSSLPSQYTGAASSVEMPLALAGVVGIAAMLF